MSEVWYDTQREAALQRSMVLTGKEWIPYPSHLFNCTFLLVDDDTAKKLLEERRRYTFPSFLSDEPDAEAITNALDEVVHNLRQQLAELKEQA